MECRSDCGICCIEISISSPIPDMPNGKPAGVRCVHLNESFKCNLFNKPTRPKICGEFNPTLEFCGSTREEAHQLITRIEQETK